MTVGGFVNGVFAPGIGYTLATGVGVSYGGTLLKKNTTAGEVDLCGAGEHPIGYAERSTVDVFGTTQTACKISVMPLLKGNVAYLVVSPTNSAIAVGDSLETAASGTVDKKSGAGEVVGIALEAVDATAGAGAYVLVLIDPYYASS